MDELLPGYYSNEIRVLHPVQRTHNFQKSHTVLNIFHCFTDFVNHFCMNFVKLL